jgi:hypothetical protein
VSHSSSAISVEVWTVTLTRCRGSFAKTLVFASLLVSAAAGQESGEVARIRAELDRLYTLNSEAFVRGDVPVLMALRADDWSLGSARLVPLNLSAVALEGD